MAPSPLLRWRLIRGSYGASAAVKAMAWSCLLARWTQLLRQMKGIGVKLCFARSAMFTYPICFASSADGENSNPGKPGGPKKPRSVADLRAARESRANEALKMKDEQLRILTEQNNQLLGSLDQAEEEANSIQMEKLAVEEENR